jgi:hypothetical protein
MWFFRKIYGKMTTLLEIIRNLFNFKRDKAERLNFF